MADIYEITRRQLYILVAAATVLSIILVIFGFVLGRNIVIPQRLPSPVVYSGQGSDPLADEAVQNLRVANTTTSSAKPFVDDEGLSFYETLDVGENTKDGKRSSVTTEQTLEETRKQARQSVNTETTVSSVPTVKPTPTPDLLELTGDTFKKAYVVQVSSVKRKAFADETVTKLKKKGFPAYISKIKFNTGIVNYRVRVGPFVHQKGANQIGEKIRKEMHLSPLVMTIRNSKK